MSDFLDQQENCRQGRNGKFFASLPDHVKALREEYHLRMASLNARGTSQLPANPGDCALPPH